MIPKAFAFSSIEMGFVSPQTPRLLLKYNVNKFNQKLINYFSDTSEDLMINGKKIHVNLLRNPSHLEVIGS